MELQEDKFVVAMAAQNSGRTTEAASLYREILNHDPMHAHAYHNLALIVLDSEGPGAAIPLLWYSMQLCPEDSVIHNSFGSALVRSGKLSEAELAFRRAIDLAPSIATYHYNLANLLSNLGKDSDAELTYLNAISLDPNFADAHNNLGNTLRSLNRPDEALSALTRAIAINQNHALAHNNIGNIKRDKALWQEAEISYREAIRIDPTLSIAYFNLANVLRETGRIRESAASLRRAIEHNPMHADAFRHLAQVEKISIDDGLVAFMQARFEDPLTPDSDRIHLGFALGRIFDQARDWDRAFAYFRTANRLHRKTISYDIRAEENSLSRIRQYFPPDRFAILPSSNIIDDTPIFIVGMMRSGTTLMEQILASHREIVGGGELKFVQELVDELKKETGKLHPNCLDDITSVRMRKMGESYLGRVRETFGDGPRFVTDKMPQNFLYLGLIDRMLPNARIIYMKRDLMDVALSAFSIFFTEPHPYAYSLEELARYCRFSEEVMNHWVRLFPSKIYVQHYEALVEDKELSIRKILDFCGLEFDPACLEFHKTKRVVSTASAIQVREELNANSVGRWRGYNKHLAPLKAALSGR